MIGAREIKPDYIETHCFDDIYLMNLGSLQVSVYKALNLAKGLYVNLEQELIIIIGIAKTNQAKKAWKLCYRKDILDIVGILQF